jgi:hypothetical protein
MEPPGRKGKKKKKNEKMKCKLKQLDMKPFPGISRKISIRLPHALAHTHKDRSKSKKENGQLKTLAGFIR